MVQERKHNLLGLPAIRALGLLSQADEVIVEPEEIHSKFPSLFTRLGTFEGDFEIHLRPDAQPFALHPPATCLCLEENGISRGDFQSGHANPMVCWDDHGTRAGWHSVHLREPQAAQCTVTLSS